MKLTVIVALAIALTLLFSACAGTFTDSSQTVKFTKTFTGKISNQYPITMTLQRDGNKIIGSYFYTEGNRTVASVEGTVDVQGNVMLVDLDASGNKLGTIKGRFTTPNSFEGEWSTIEQPENHRPFSMATGPAASAPVVASTPALSMDEQAIAEVRRVFEKTAFTKCDDSYYSIDNALDATYGGQIFTGIAQRRNPRYEIETRYPITEADKLNEVTWKGTVILKFDAIRYYSNGSWVDWRPYQPLTMYELTVNKRNAKWVADIPYILKNAQSKISCSDVPH